MTTTLLRLISESHVAINLDDIGRRVPSALREPVEGAVNAQSAYTQKSSIPR